MNYILDILIIVLLIGAGIYALYSCFRLKKERVLFDNKILYPSNCQPSNCLDADGFIDYILPRMTAFGWCCLAAAICTALTTWVIVGAFIYIVETLLVLGIFVYISVIQNRASKLFW